MDVSTGTGECHHAWTKYAPGTLAISYRNSATATSALATTSRPRCSDLYPVRAIDALTRVKST